ncbi:MAG: hypothetical protein OEW24_06320 [Chloroflexota bacterium]|nr:hypothetical protein [Chloroflexota bacterium]
MRPTRLPAVIAVSLLVLLLAACGGNNPSATTDNGGGGGNNPSATSDNGGGGGETSPSATTDNGGGGGGGDAAGVAADLVPPNSTQVSQTNAEGTLWTVYESTDSPESLKGFYESAIPQTGMHVYSTTNADNTYSWVFAQSDGSEFGGSVTVAPSSEGGSGSSVIVFVASGG